MRETMRADLKSALKSRDRTAVAALRSILSALDNAEAVPADQPLDGPAGSEHIAGAAVGVGATEARRRPLSDADIRSILEGEIRERSSAAAQYTSIDRPDLADPLLTEATILTRYLPATP